MHFAPGAMLWALCPMRHASNALPCTLSVSPLVSELRNPTSLPAIVRLKPTLASRTNSAFSVPHPEFRPKIVFYLKFLPPSDDSNKDY
jgi:hypothetical protein